MNQRWPDKLIIGLTGNIATGKSAIMKMAAERSALTLDADLIVHQVLDSDSDAQTTIIASFGPQVEDPAGGLNRKVIADIVFNDPVALLRLESILHPRVRQRLWQRLESSQDTIVFIEAIKLFEGGLADECDQVWVTHCPTEIQIERLMTYRHMDRETARTRVDAQAPQELKMSKADVLIDTSGSLESTRSQFQAAWNDLAKLLAPSISQPVPPGQRSSPPLMEESTQPELDESTGEIADTESPSEPKPANPAVNLELDVSESAIVRRARPTDIPAILLLIRKASNDTIKYSRGELLIALGDRGYLIGQVGTEISAILGWHAENLVATIDQFFVYPATVADKTGGAVLREVEQTANELACEVIIAFPLNEGPEELRQLFQKSGFALVDPETLPKAWKAAVSESQPDNSSVMCKQLRDTRGINIQAVSSDQ